MNERPARTIANGIASPGHREVGDGAPRDSRRDRDLHELDLAVAERHVAHHVREEHEVRDLVGRPRHRRDRLDAEPAVDLGATRVEDARDHLGDAVDLASDRRRDDVGVVAARDGHVRVAAVHPRLLEHVAVEHHAAHGRAVNDLPRRLNDNGSLSITTTSWRSKAILVASCAPTRPQPPMMTFTLPPPPVLCETGAKARP